MFIDSMSEIEDNNEFDVILGSTNLDELDLTSSMMNKQQDLSEELLGVISAPADDAIGTSGVAPQEGMCGELCIGLDSCQRSAPSLPNATVQDTLYLFGIN